MRLVRFQLNGQPKIGVVQEQGIVGITELFPEFVEMRQLAAAGRQALQRLAERAAGATPLVALDEVRLLAPIERPGKFMGIGLNYRDHAEEAARLGVPFPDQQLWFNKQTTCLSGPFDEIDPGVTEKLDYEVELGYVIGEPARYVSAKDAPDHIFGYFVANDVSARDWQKHSSTHTMGKSFDTHGPIGPWIITPDEVPNPHSLEVRCYVNGELRQQSNTDQFVFNIWSQIEYLSTAFPLESGDLLITGTPGGVGIAMNPPQHLHFGDVVRCEIDGIGFIENKVGASTAPAKP